MRTPAHIDEHLRSHEKHSTYKTVMETFLKPPHVKRPQVFLNYFSKKEPTLEPGTPLKDLAMFQEEFTALLKGAVFAYETFVKHPSNTPYPDATTHAYKKLRGVDRPNDDYCGVIRHLRDVKELIIIANEHLPELANPLREWDRRLFDEEEVSDYITKSWARHAARPGTTREDTIDRVLNDVTDEYHAEMHEDDLKPYLRMVGNDQESPHTA